MIPAKYTLYSWKHTGAAHLYEATKDLLLIQRLCGHESVTTTMHYLRGIGVVLGTDTVEGHLRLGKE